jgi:hypothetical protein
MKTLSSALSAAIGAPVQQPAILVQAAFGTVRRWSSFATTTWNGQLWTKEDITLEQLQVGALRVSGTLVVGNNDDGIGALVLSEGVQDRSITIWGYDAAATATGDVVWLCTAVGASAQVGLRDVRIALRHRSEFLQAPRTFVGPAAGINGLLPAGASLRINGIDYVLERR